MQDNDPFAETLDSDPMAWRTAAQILARRPYLTERTIRTWRETGRLRYTKRGAGKRSLSLYRLRDIDQLVEGFIVQPTCGPLAEGEGK